ncbi:hypothetical protein M419DRAFT_48435, partial [Trichoderma reesei RUT C-30]
GVNYLKIFAFIIKLIIYKALFTITAVLDLKLEQIDIKTAFLYKEVKEDIYIKQPTGF